jgi:signal transduction histidine kinase
MKQILTSILLLFFISTTHAQKPSKLDSLKNVLAHLPAEGKSFASDTLRVGVLCAMGEFENAVLSVQKMNNDKFASISYNRIGKLMSSNKNFYRVGEILFKALFFAEKSKDELLIADSHWNIGKNYYDLKNHNLCRQHSFKAKKLYLKNYNYYGVLNSIKLIGNSYIGEKENKKALEWYNLCMRLGNDYKINSFKPNLLGNIAIAYEQENMLDSAIIYNQKAIEEVNLNFPDNIVTKVSCLIEISYIYLLKKDLKTAIIYGQDALKLCDKNNLNLKSFAHRVLYKGYAGSRQFEPAFANLMAYKELRDSLELIKQDQQVKSIKSDYENELSKNKLLLQDKVIENKNFQRNFFAIVGAIFLIVAVGFWYTKNKIAQQKDEIELQNIEISKVKNSLEELNESLEEKVKIRTSELTQANLELQGKNEEIMKALVEGQTIERKRVAEELHDNIGSAISAIKWRLEALDGNNLTEKEQKIYVSILSMMSNVYSEIRLISHNLLPAELEKNGINGALQKLIDDINLSQKIHFSLVIDPEINIDKKVELELYSVCLELINNILKHSQATKASIVFEKRENSVLLRVSDNGIGINENNSASTMGMANISKRINSIKGTVRVLESCQFQIDSPLEAESNQPKEMNQSQTNPQGLLWEIEIPNNLKSIDLAIS